MAPALVETATSNNGPVPASVYKVDLGQYKEIDLTYIDKNAEEGKSGGPAAHVSLLYDPIGFSFLQCGLYTQTDHTVPSLPSNMEPSTTVLSSPAF